MVIGAARVDWRNYPSAINAEFLFTKDILCKSCFLRVNFNPNNCHSTSFSPRVICSRKDDAILPNPNQPMACHWPRTCYSSLQLHIHVKTSPLQHIVVVGLFKESTQVLTLSGLSWSGVHFKIWTSNCHRSLLNHEFVSWFPFPSITDEAFHYLEVCDIFIATFDSVCS